MFSWLVAGVLLLPACGPAGDRSDPRSDTGSAAIGSAEAGPNCVAHGAPTELCFICDASLRDSGRLWCREHDRYEDRCWLCHPELEDKDRLWCEKHSLYEDECFLCHPELLDGRPGDADEAAASSLFCREHGVPEAECGICHPDSLAQPAGR